MSQLLTRGGATFIAFLSILGISLFCVYLIHANATTAAIMLLLGVLFSGAYQKLPAAVVASFTATLCLDYFFVPPIGSITIGDPQGWIVLSVFLTVSLAATRLASGLRKQRDELILRQAETEKLHALGRSVLLSGSGNEVRRLIVNKCIELFDLVEVVLLETATGQFYRSQAESSIPDEKLRRVLVYGSIDYYEAEELTVMPVALGNKTLGSLGFRGLFLPEGTLQAIGNTAAIGLARAQAQEAGTRAEAVRKSEELKSVMIDALAHDLKTPLTAIEAAASMLLQSVTISMEQRNDLLNVIQEESQGLGRMVDEAIHLARIDAKRLKLECQPLRVDEVIQAAVHSVEARGSSHQIRIDLAEDIPLIFADRELIVQALKQLLDNALKYGPARSAITISVMEAEGFVSISVRDCGQGLTELEQGRVFDKFYRGRYDRSAVQGTGMGLAIAKEIVAAHGGHIGVESQIGQGSRFTIRLHCAPKTVEMEPQQV